MFILLIIDIDIGIPFDESVEYITVYLSLGGGSFSFVRYISTKSADTLDAQKRDS